MQKLEASLAPPDSTSGGNPILPVHAADPHLVIVGDRYWIYATDAGVYEGAAAFAAGRPLSGRRGFGAWSSEDLLSWRFEGQVLSFDAVDWAREHDWAPAMVQRDGRFYLYFCADSSIGVAVSDSPSGPFRDAIGRPLVEHRADMSAIDPMPFIDDDGQAFLHFGAVPGYWLEGKVPHVATALSVRPLADDMVSFAGPERATVATRRGAGERWGNRHHIEAPFLFRRRNIYYLSWSQGSCTSCDLADAYRVNYATSRSPLGPWTIAAEHNPVLESDPALPCFAPGHHSVINIPGTDEWYIAYHANDGRHADIPGAVCDRRVWINRLHFRDDGSIVRIRPTRRGPGRRTL